MISTSKTVWLALTLTLSPGVYAQIPVTVTSDIPAMINQVETMAKWAAQYQQMVSQINQMKAQYEAITGTRGLGQIYNDPALRNYLPDEWAGVYDKVKSGGLSSISSTAKSMSSSEGMDPLATGGKKRQQDTMVANKAMAMEAYKQTLDRLNNINALMVKADATKDAKAAADLQNRIASENAMIQNEQIRLNLMAQLQTAEIKLADQQRAREFQSKYLK